MGSESKRECCIPEIARITNLTATEIVTTGFLLTWYYDHPDTRVKRCQIQAAAGGMRYSGIFGNLSSIPIGYDSVRIGAYSMRLMRGTRYRVGVKCCLWFATGQGSCEYGPETHIVVTTKEVIEVTTALETTSSRGNSPSVTTSKPGETIAPGEVIEVTTALETTYSHGNPPSVTTYKPGETIAPGPGLGLLMGIVVIISSLFVVAAAIIAVLVKKMGRLNRTVRVGHSKPKQSMVTGDQPQLSGSHATFSQGHSKSGVSVGFDAVKEEWEGEMRYELIGSHTPLGPSHESSGKRRRHRRSKATANSMMCSNDSQATWRGHNESVAGVGFDVLKGEWEMGNELTRSHAPLGPSHKTSSKRRPHGRSKANVNSRMSITDSQATSQGHNKSGDGVGCNAMKDVPMSKGSAKRSRHTSKSHANMNSRPLPVISLTDNGRSKANANSRMSITDSQATSQGHNKSGDGVGCNAMKDVPMSKGSAKRSRHTSKVHANMNSRPLPVISLTDNGFSDKP